MTIAARTGLVARDTILKLMSDEEIARVSTAEAASGLRDGAEYLDLEHIDRGNDNFGQKLFERHVGQGHLGSGAFSGGTRCDACQHVAGAERRRSCEKLTQIGERIGRCAGLHAILALRVLGLRLGLRL